MGKDTPETEVIQFAQDRQVSLSSVLRESLRNSDRFCVLKTRRHHAVFDKSDFTPDDAGQWIEQIDAITDSARLLKNGNTCFVTAVTRRGRDYVIKRYNPKGLLHSFRHTLKRSRARRGWLNAHRLHYLGIPTPRPVGFIEEYAGPFIKRSWLISEMAPGPKLHDYLADPPSPKTANHICSIRYFIFSICSTGTASPTATSSTSTSSSPPTARPLSTWTPSKYTEQAFFTAITEIKTSAHSTQSAIKPSPGPHGSLYRQKAQVYGSQTEGLLLSPSPSI
jgi:hypothetical protein